MRRLWQFNIARISEKSNTVIDKHAVDERLKDAKRQSRVQRLFVGILVPCLWQLEKAEEIGLSCAIFAHFRLEIGRFWAC
jgi:hypothetical protein